MKGIIVKLQVEGFHYWPEAFEKVSYLKELHRHIFHIECHKNVSHADREIEIIEFKRSILMYLYDQFSSFSGQPCYEFANAKAAFR